MAKKKGSFYAVAVGRQPGVYKTWTEAGQQVKGFPHANHKSFATEAEAWDYVESYRQDDQESSHSETSQVGEDVAQLEEQLESTAITHESTEIEVANTWAENLRGGVHEHDLVAFCAGSAPLNGREGCTAAYAVSFPLEEIRTRSVQVTVEPTNNHADCLAAHAATTIADELNPNRERKLVIYTRYQGLVFAMARHDGQPRRIDRWQTNGWRTSDNKPVSHGLIYEAFLEADQHRTILWRLIDKDTDPEWLVQLHTQTHDEAESVARNVTADGA